MGKVIGSVLAGVLMSIATARGMAISSQIPELVRLSENLKRFGWVRAETKRAAAASAERPAPPPPPRVPPSSRPPEPDDDTFVLTADAAAIAAVLQQASQTGVPFCEECEKARLAQLAGSQA